MIARPKVCHIMKIKGVSGAENHLLTLLPEMADDFDIRLLMLVEKGNFMADFAMEFERKGVEVKRVVINNHYDAFAVPRLFKCIREYKPDIVHTHLIHGDLYGLIAAKIAGTGLLISSKHGYDNYESTSKLYKINGLFSGWLDSVITISNALQPKVEAAEGIPGSKMRTILYGLDHEKYTINNDPGFARKEFGVSDETCLIGSVGRLIPVKGYDSLIKAASEIHEDYRLLIMGGGPLREDLESMASGLGIKDKISFLGYREDVSRILSGLDIFMFPTLGEGFGLVLLEAMAHRLPVVATDTMAIPEVVEHEKTGILVPPKDVLSMRKALERLIRSPNERIEMGRRGFERLRDEFSVQGMVDRTKALYSELLDASGPYLSKNRL